MRSPCLLLHISSSVNFIRERNPRGWPRGLGFALSFFVCFISTILCRSVERKLKREYQTRNDVYYSLAFLSLRFFSCVFFFSHACICKSVWPIKWQACFRYSFEALENIKSQSGKTQWNALEIGETIEITYSARRLNTYFECTYNYAYTLREMHFDNSLMWNSTR